MAWVRSHLRLATVVALFALATQLTLAFGHLHLDELSSRAEIASIAPAPTADHDRPGHPPDDICAICIVTGLLAAAQSPAPPIVPAPPAEVTIAPVRGPADFAIATPALAFRSRAPPLV